MPIQRLARLSDIIYAVAMTILATFFDPIPLDNISSATATQLLLQQLQGIGIYIITFITLGFYWYSHVNQFKHYQQTDAVHTFLNLFSLLFVLLLTFASDLSGSYEGVFIIDLFYSSTAIGLGAFATAAWIYGTQNRQLVAPDISDEKIRHIRQESYIEPSIYILAIGADLLVHWGWSAVVTLGFPIAFVLQVEMSRQNIEESKGASEK